MDTFSVELKNMLKIFDQRIASPSEIMINTNKQYDERKLLLFAIWAVLRVYIEDLTRVLMFY